MRDGGRYPRCRKAPAPQQPRGAASGLKFGNFRRAHSRVRATKLHECEGAGTVLPSRAPHLADVPLAERMALSVEEAGALLGISRDLAYDLVARGEVPSVRLGRRLVVPRRALEGGLDRLSEAG